MVIISILSKKKRKISSSCHLKLLINLRNQENIKITIKINTNYYIKIDHIHQN